MAISLSVGTKGHIVGAEGLLVGTKGLVVGNLQVRRRLKVYAAKCNAELHRVLAQRAL